MPDAGRAADRVNARRAPGKLLSTPAMRTRRRRRWLGAAAALVAQLTAGSVGAALPDGARGSESLADLESLAPGVYVRVPPLETPDESPGNQGVVVFDDGLLIIDAGPPHVAAPLAERLASRFEVPVRWLFATHFHPDHSLGSSMWAADGIRFFAAEGGRSGFENVCTPWWLAARKDSPQMRCGTSGRPTSSPTPSKSPVGGLGWS